MVHTIVTDAPGPDRQLPLAGISISQVLPLSIATGNITVACAAFSYAGQLTITIVAGPDAAPDLPMMKRA